MRSTLNTVVLPATTITYNFKKNEIKDEKKPKRWFEFETKIIWPNLIVMIVYHAITLYCVFIFPFFEKPHLFFMGYAIAFVAGIGVTGGAHRLWTHRAYKAKTPLRIILACFYFIAGQQRIYDWVRNHRVHHKYVDTDADPHDSRRGFWFSHLGWLVLKKKPEVRKRDMEIDMSDIISDPVVQFFDRHYVVMFLLWAFIIPTILTMYIFNESAKWSIMSQVLMRYPAVLHCTWCVNSIAHMWGMRPYNKSSSARQSAFVSYITVGEGWHNYHHVFPRDYRASELNGFYNPCTHFLHFFGKIGWAYDFIAATPEQINRSIATKGDGSHVIQKEILEELQKYN